MRNVIQPLQGYQTVALGVWHRPISVSESLINSKLTLSWNDTEQMEEF